jgi:hypothetical protein
MGIPENTYAVWAMLNEEGIPVLCSKEEADEWWLSHDNAKNALIRSESVGAWLIEAMFSRYSLALDGPPLFWRVICHRDETFVGGSRWFGTREAALEFHAHWVEMFRTHGDYAWSSSSNGNAKTKPIGGSGN